MPGKMGEDLTVGPCLDLQTKPNLCLRKPKATRNTSILLIQWNCFLVRQI